MSKMTKEKREQIATSARKYNNTMSILQEIVNGVGPLQETAADAFRFWTGYAEKKGSDAWKDVNDPPFEVEDHPMFWSGVAYGINLLAGFNCSQIAESLTEEQIEEIDAALQG